MLLRATARSDEDEDAKYLRLKNQKADCNQFGYKILGGVDLQQEYLRKLDDKMNIYLLLNWEEDE